MLEVHAHTQLKELLKRLPITWPHTLTLSRLVARSLRSGDSTSITLEDCSQDSWWLGLLIPLYLKSSGVILILSSSQRFHLLSVRVPKFPNLIYSDSPSKYKNKQGADSRPSIDKVSQKSKGSWRQYKLKRCRYTIFCIC